MHLLGIKLIAVQQALIENISLLKIWLSGDTLRLGMTG